MGIVSPWKLSQEKAGDRQLPIQNLEPMINTVSMRYRQAAARLRWKHTYYAKLQPITLLTHCRGLT